MTSRSNTALIKALQNREKWALKHLFDTYWEKMLIYAHKILSDQQLCEDIVQEIFINLWEKAPERQIRNLEPYLFKALKYRIANAIRDSKYTLLSEDHLNQLESQYQNPTEIEYQDLELQIQKLMESLPQKCQNVFYLSRVKHYNNKEISQQLNISIRTVETHISHAIKHFRIHLNSILILVYMFVFS